MLACKHYNRALRVHKLVLEALERQLLIKFLATSDDEEVQEVQNATATLFSPSKEKLQAVMDSGTCQQLYEQYSLFKIKVKDGLLGKKQHSCGFTTWT